MASRYSFASENPLDLIKYLITDFPSDWEWHLWDRKEINRFNKLYKADLPFCDWRKYTVKPVLHFPGEFVRRMNDQGDIRTGYAGTKNGNAVISFGTGIFPSYLVRTAGKIYLVKYTEAK